VALASAGPYANLHLAPDRQPRQQINKIIKKIMLPTTQKSLKNYVTAQFFYKPDALPAAQPTASKH